MMMHRKSGQWGMSVPGMILMAIVVGWSGLVAVQLVPILLEAASVRKAVVKAAAEAHSVTQVRETFDRVAQIDDIKSLQGKDLDVFQDGDRYAVSYAYQREFHLIGPAWITMKYQGRAP